MERVEPGLCQAHATEVEKTQEKTSQSFTVQSMSAGHTAAASLDRGTEESSCLFSNTAKFLKNFKSYRYFVSFWCFRQDMLDTRQLSDQRALALWIVTIVNCQAVTLVNLTIISYDRRPRGTWINELSSIRWSLVSCHIQGYIAVQYCAAPVPPALD
jgi:hypothetical protein